MNRPAQNKKNTSYIGRYELDVKLGEGATGIVFRAYDPVMDRDVAIKSALSTRLTADQIKAVIAEFHYEARIAGKFAHENIVAIYDIIQHDNLDHIVMEYVPGCSVQDYMKATGQMDIDEVIRVSYKTCVGLAYIHFHGVIHRDIKPGNIMYHPAEGITKLMDFSIAHNLEDPPAKDNGTIAYMAPEHFTPNGKITFLTDIFAMGATMYRMLSGKYPFTNKNTIQQILNEEPPSLELLRPDAPQALVKIINKAMEKSNTKRYQSAAALAHDLRQLADTLYPDAKLCSNQKNYMSI